MPTRNISLTAEQDAFVEKIIEAGEYQNASEAVRDALRALKQRRRGNELKRNALGARRRAGGGALRALKQRRRENELKLKAWRARLRVGVEALDRGDFVELDETELEGYLRP